MNSMARLQRVWAIDLGGCPNGGGELQVIAALTAPGVIARIIEPIVLEPISPRAH